jgi:D-alanyl-lipoteichoic acid acyltransferase DltB (MBOAT superfamily)
VRATELLPQLSKLPPFDHVRAADGLHRIVIGLFKKIAIGDFLATALADRVFEDPSLYSSAEVTLGVYAYAFQIYLDFSAYSDIAIGSAQLLGFTLPENFRTPYRAASLQEFWRRWHISLSTWLRDYLYKPLGGNRGGSVLTYRNLVLTMLLGGLWHGASWTFIVWGLLHGGGLAVTRAYQRHVDEHGGGGHVVMICLAIFGAGLTLHLVVERMGGLGSVWADLALAWAYCVPLWAAITAWLAAGEPPTMPARPRTRSFARETLIARFLGAAAILGLLAALREGERSLWLPLCVAAAALAWIADVADVAPDEAYAHRWLRWSVRRALGVFLTFHYVCLAWIFFRAQTFDGALAVLSRLGAGEHDTPNIIPSIQLALLAAALAHFYAPRTFAWWRDRFVTAPAMLQGAALAGAALVLRELAVPHIVPFIYFQF